MIKKYVLNNFFFDDQEPYRANNTMFNGTPSKIQKLHALKSAHTFLN